MARFFFQNSGDPERNKRRFVCNRASSDVSILLLRASALWRTAFGIAEGADINIQLSKGANESAPVHSQHSSGFALIPVDISENDENEVPFKFSQRFVINDACPMHPPH
jgi:hypothetical protein